MCAPSCTAPCQPDILPGHTDRGHPGAERAPRQRRERRGVCGAAVPRRQPARLCARAERPAHCAGRRVCQGARLRCLPTPQTLACRPRLAGALQCGFLRRPTAGRRVCQGVHLTHAGWRQAASGRNFAVWLFAALFRQLVHVLNVQPMALAAGLFPAGFYAKAQKSLEPMACGA